MAQDLLTDVYANSAGPFSSYLAAPTYQSTAPLQPGAGYMGAAGKTAMILDNFLQGVSKGRFQAFQRSEKERMDNLALVQNAVQAVSNSSLPEPEKNAQFGKLNQMMAQLVLSDHAQGGGGKKGGKKGTPADGQPQSLGHHVLQTMRGLATNMLGPGAQKQVLDPAEIKGELFDVYKAIGSPQNSAQAQGERQGQAINQAFGEAQARNTHVTHNPQTGQMNIQGQPATETQLLNDPGFRTMMNQQIAANGGKLPPMLAAILQNAQANEEAQRRISDPLYQAELRRSEAQELRDKAYASGRTTPEERMILGPQIGLTGDALRSYIATGRLPAGFGNPTADLTGEMKTLYSAYRGQGLSDEEARRRAGEQVAQKYSLTPERRLELQQSFRRDLFNQTQESSINRFYDGELATIDRSKQSQDQKDKQKQAVEERRAKDIDRLHNGTAAPPKSKAAAAGAGAEKLPDASAVANAIVNAISGGSPSAPPASQPKKGDSLGIR